MSSSLLSRVASFARSPQGRRLSEQARRAAKDPRNRARIEQVRARLAKPRGDSARGAALYLRRVLRVDRLALELHRRCQLGAARLPVDRQDLELLDLLDARELLVGAVDPGLDL